MTIQEAIKSGRPFHRKAWDWWWFELMEEKDDSGNKTTIFSRVLSMQPTFTMKHEYPPFNLEDILADDWETKP